MDKQTCTHPYCLCESKDNCYAEKVNKHLKQIEIKNAVNGDNSGIKSP